MLQQLRALWRLATGASAKTLSFSGLARQWSNDQLAVLRPHVTGDVVNVSAWRDEDKEGGHYRDYFPHARRYAITNMDGDRGLQGLPDELRLDLNEPLPTELRGTFDVVFNHTTLEHVFDTQTAFRNLCEMSRDLVVLVVPYLQPNHGTDGIPDFWRFTPYALRHMFAQHGLEVVYETATPHPFSAVYLFSIGARQPDVWRARLPQARLPDYGLGLPVFLGWPWRRKWHQLRNRHRKGAAPTGGADL